MLARALEIASIHISPRTATSPQIYLLTLCSPICTSGQLLQTATGRRTILHCWLSISFPPPEHCDIVRFE